MTLEEGIKELGKLVENKEYEKALNLIHDLEGFTNNTNEDYKHCNLGLSLSKIALEYTDSSLALRAISHLKAVKVLPENFKFVYKFNLARTLIHHYHLSSDLNLKITNSKNLLIAKKLYLELLDEHWKGYILNESHLSLALCDLIIIVIEFGRWAEAFYYLNILEKKGINNSYTGYLRIRLMDEISNRTCSEDPEYPIFSATILELCERVILDSEADVRTQTLGISKSHQLLFDRHNLILQEVLQKKHKNEDDLRQYSKYRQFVLSENLALNEHALFCKCRRSKSDDLKLINRHVIKFHKNFMKIKRFELAIYKLIREFNIARLNYYQATTVNKVITYNSEIQKYSGDVILNDRSELLISSFKQCFGILDKIAMVLVKYYNQTPKGDISFENVFANKKTGLKNHIGSENGGFYLRAIYSIFMDLNRQEYSALDEFKEWRNSIEHEFLFLVEESTPQLKIKYPEAKHLVTYKEFQSKTLLLLHLTRSAIFSLVYLLRLESK